MVAFSGFYESHEPPPLGNAHSIELPHRHLLIVALAAARAIRNEL